jgi:putative zinc finger protein
MDHTYIDENSLAERYLNHALSGDELRAFEEHIVDCQECADRLLLAEMFHARNGVKPKPVEPEQQIAEPDRHLVARLVLYKPRTMVLTLIAAALAVPAAFLLWTLIWRS